MMRRNISIDPFERLAKQFGTMPFQSGGGVDVSEHDGEVVITLDVPGFSKEEITVNYDNGQLHIKAEKTSEDEEDAILAEHRSSYEQVIPFPDATHWDWEDASATYQNGVLTVEVPKSNDAETGETIPVQ